MGKKEKLRWYSLLRLSQWGYWGPLIHSMGPCSRPGEDPNALKQFGPEPGPSSSESLGIVLLRNEGFWMGNYVGGGGQPPFWRTLIGPVRGLTPGHLKNKHSTHTLPSRAQLSIYIG